MLLPKAAKQEDSSHRQSLPSSSLLGWKKLSHLHSGLRLSLLNPASFPFLLSQMLSPINCLHYSLPLSIYFPEEITGLPRQISDWDPTSKGVWNFSSQSCPARCVPSTMGCRSASPPHCSAKHWPHVAMLPCWQNCHLSFIFIQELILTLG